MSSYIDRTAGAIEHCEAMAAEFPDLAEKYYQPMAEACAAKLWHQLTIKVLDFLTDPSASRTTHASQSTYLALYNQVISVVDKKLNPLSLARMAAAVAASLIESGDATAAKAVLENLLASVEDPSAKIYLQSKHAFLTLQPLLSTPVDAQAEPLATIKSTLEENQSRLEELAPGDNQAIVQAAHYEAAMTMAKVVGPPEAFYAAALSFLNYAPPPAALGKSVPPSSTDYHQLAVDLCLAALTGEGVYNLGQVEQTPVLTQLAGDDHWLVELLHACAAGDVLGFRHLTDQYAAQIAQQPALVHRASAVQEKLTLLALVHYISSKAAHERTLDFASIAERLHVGEEQVEWVCMRALSVGVIEGCMDQVDQTLQVDWVLPRVLNNDQLSELAGRFAEWAGKVAKTKDYMQEQTPTFA